MTREEFDKISDGWYNRTKSLWAYFKDTSKKQYRREKAGRLALVMTKRMLRLKDALNEAAMKERTKPSAIIDFPKGGITYSQQEPHIL